MQKRRGLPGQLEQEIYDAVFASYIKYRKMRKSHMSKDRITGIIFGAVQIARYEAEQEYQHAEQSHEPDGVQPATILG